MNSRDPFPEDPWQQAQWWEWHMVELRTGVPPEAPRGTAPRPGFDPAAVPLTQRERMKAEELNALGVRIGASGVRKRRQRYERDGVMAMVDGRKRRETHRFGRSHPSVVEAMRTAVNEYRDGPPVPATVVFRRAREIWDASAPEGIEFPSDRTLYRIYHELEKE
ncbi:hypothetical protein [Phytoactinopolyspora halotolerans]|uniref:Uncharacterized protein n=1 Tax=Phytoactinopolyspora halotolerans TaxID=1981512 RepID=A0A6L9SFP5_9ACTN|nr:hypothetical protein [Phytoactinopolyspora halotolerans]NEE03923.1 hypothetical protein [Phytoactinopolyspora halotolerans]